MVNHPNRSRRVIKLVRHDSGFQNIVDNFSVYDGEYVDEVVASIEEYLLPAGYKVRMTVAGERAIFAEDETRACDLTGSPSGRPAVISSKGRIVLNLAKTEPSAD